MPKIRSWLCCVDHEELFLVVRVHHREDDLSALEIQYIAEYDSYNNGYNMGGGGEGRGRHDMLPETKAKISKARKGLKPSLEARIKMSQAKQGTKASNETKQRMSESQKGSRIGCDAPLFKPWYIKYPNGDIEFFYGITKKDYAVKNGLNVTTFANRFGWKFEHKEFTSGAYKGYTFGNLEPLKEAV